MPDDPKSPLDRAHAAAEKSLKSYHTTVMKSHEKKDAEIARLKAAIVGTKPERKPREKKAKAAE